VPTAAFETRLAVRLVVGRRPASAGPSGEHLLDDTLAVARAAEAGGFDAVWVPDEPRLVARRPGPTGGFEAMTLLGALATATSSARVGALATAVGDRPPGLLAKQVTTLDVLSEGRAILGLALAPRWRRTAGDRIDRVGEVLTVCRAMFGSDEARVGGRHFSVDGAVNRPSPPQGAQLPIVVLARGDRAIVDLALERADGICLPARAPRAAKRLGAALAARRGLGSGTERCRILVLVRARTSAWAGAGHTRLVGEVGTWLERGADGVVLDLPTSVPVAAVAEAGRVLHERFGQAGAGA
jgi:alkanesulfonate monooxygenase